MSLLLGLLASGLVGTIVFVILLVIRPISERVFSKTWHYYSLAVPLVFLLGGTLLAGGLMNHAQNLSAESNNTAPSIHVEAAELQNNFVMQAMPVNFTIVEPAVDVVPVQESRLFDTEQLLSSIAGVATYAVFLWALGAVLFVGMSVRKYLRYRRLVLCQAKSYPNDCTIPVFTSHVAHTPMLIGIIKPVIVLPQIQLKDEELDVILAHEMVHYRRKDLVYKMVGFIANAVHWYNPAVYALNRQLNMLCELSCDEKVASEMGAMDRKFYGETILQVLHHSVEQRSLAGNLMCATNLCSSPKDVKMRLTNMMNTKKISKHVAVLSLMVGILVAGMGFAMSHIVGSAMPVYAEEVPALDEWDEWLEWFDSLTPEEQAYVSLRPPQGNPATIASVNQELAQANGSSFTRTEGFEFQIPFIAAGELVLLGKVNLEQGQILEVSMEVEEGSGFFIGRSNSSQLNNVLEGNNRAGWMPFQASLCAIGIDQRLLSVELMQGGGTYLYIGSTYPMHTVATNLSNVTVQVSVRSDNIEISPIFLEMSESAQRLFGSVEDTNVISVEAAAQIAADLLVSIFGADLEGVTMQMHYSQFEPPHLWGRTSVWSGVAVLDGSDSTKSHFNINAETGELISIHYNPWGGEDVKFDILHETEAIAQQNIEFARIAMDIVQARSILEGVPARARLISSPVRSSSHEAGVSALVAVECEQGGVATLNIIRDSEIAPAVQSITIETDSSWQSMFQFESDWVSR